MKNHEMCKLVRGYNTHAERSVKQQKNVTNRNRTKLPGSQSRDIDESCCSFHRYRGHLGSLLAEDSTTLLVILPTILVEGGLFSDGCVSFAKHLPIGLVVFIEASRTTREPADKVLWMISGARVCYRARPFDGLPARRGST